MEISGVLTGQHHDRQVTKQRITGRSSTWTWQKAVTACTAMFCLTACTVTVVLALGLGHRW